MVIRINLKSEEIKFFRPSSSVEEGLRWSYFNVYYLLDIRSIYQLFWKHGNIDSIKSLSDYCREEKITAENREPWSNRKLLEINNCLRKIGFTDGNKALKGPLFNDSPEDELSDHDKKIFENVFFNYFRFRDFHKLFTSNVDHQQRYTKSNLSNVIYVFKTRNRFFDSFFIPISNQEIAIEDKDSDIMRFWDVYIKWAEELGLIQRFSLKTLGIEYSLKCRDVNVVFYPQPMPNNFSIVDYCENIYGLNYVYIPQLYWMIIRDFGYSLYEIRDRLIEECLIKRPMYRLQSTSKIFVNDKEDKILPIVDNRYMSHLLKI